MYRIKLTNTCTVIAALLFFQSVAHAIEFTTFVKNELENTRKQDEPRLEDEERNLESIENTVQLEKQLRAIFDDEMPYIGKEDASVARDSLAALEKQLRKTEGKELRINPTSFNGKQEKALSKKDTRQFHPPVIANGFPVQTRNENVHGALNDVEMESLPQPSDGRYGYLNEWVVHLEGGTELAASVLKDLGYHAVGQVSGFKDLYRVARLEHPRLHKREAQHLTSQLRSHRQVVWAEQQQSMIREKKSYIDFMDPDSDRPLVRVKRNMADIFEENTVKLNHLIGYDQTVLEDPAVISSKHLPLNHEGSQARGMESDEEKKTQELLDRISRFALNTRSATAKAELSDIFNDELVDSQWYLYDTRVKESLPRLDLGVLGAWKRNYTGHGVRVMILDDGIDYLHDDLRLNYDPSISFDFNDDDSDPYPRFSKLVVNSHGTKCAGEVAMAANNGRCGVGVAFESSIGGIRMLDGHISDRVEGESLSFARSLVDIVSCSWGPSDDGQTVEGPGRLAAQAFENGIKEGRGGKGTVFIWASGNGGMTDDNCNADGYASSVYTTAVTSASQSNKFPWYGERCASTLTSVYSSGAYSDQKIISTDLNNTCTTTFSGTSAAAPLAAGIVALALEANPALTWRDVQHLAVVSSNYDTLSDNEGWQQNALGLFFNLRFGFGLMDADKMVSNAVSWTQVPDKIIRSVNASQQIAGNWPQAFNGQKKANLTFQVPGELMQNGTFLEHIEVVLTIVTPTRGSLSILLQSPRGTATVLLTPRDKDVSGAGFQSWPFMSVHTWGEDPRGTWILTVIDTSLSSATSRVSEATLVLHAATAVPPYAQQQYQQQYEFHEATRAEQRR